MNIKHGNGTTKLGPGVEINLTGDEVVRAIWAYLVAHNIHIDGPRTTRINNKLCQDAQIYVDPSGFVINKGIKISGRE